MPKIDSKQWSLQKNFLGRNFTQKNASPGGRIVASSQVDSQKFGFDLKVSQNRLVSKFYKIAMFAHKSIVSKLFENGIVFKILAT